MAEVYILLGGNLGDKSKIFADTIKQISEKIGPVKRRSSVYVTESWGFTSAPFWNQALICDTDLLPHDVLTQSQAIEKAMGRIEKSTRYIARVMDIDLLFYNDLQINSAGLTIPHPRMQDRKFVLIPLNEIAAGKRHPVSGLTVAEMLSLCQDELRVERL